MVVSVLFPRFALWKKNEKKKQKKKNGKYSVRLLPNSESVDWLCDQNKRVTTRTLIIGAGKDHISDVVL